MTRHHGKSLAGLILDQRTAKAKLIIAVSQCYGRVVWSCILIPNAQQWELPPAAMQILSTRSRWIGKPLKCGIAHPTWK
jgi:hypothetical protein